ncbi:MAG: tetratricopeptide repeat protein, partial [Gemmatimonadota bacterium]
GFAAAFAVLGDTSRARQLLDEHKSLVRERDYPVAAAHLFEQRIFALVANRAGRPEQALGHLTEGCRYVPAFAVCDSRAFLEAAEAYDRLGRSDSAIAAYERFVRLKALRHIGPPTMFDVTTPKIAPAWRRLGELWESKGDQRRAIEAYERFLELWRNADAELQPIVREVQERTNRLRRATG